MPEWALNSGSHNTTTTQCQQQTSR